MIASPQNAPSAASGRLSRLFSRANLRQAGILAMLVAGLSIFLGVANHHYPINEWIVWRYLYFASLSLLWGVSCLGVGLLLLRLALPGRLWLSERCAFGFGLGVLSFDCCIFLVGLAGLLSKVSFVLLPLSFLLLGFRELRKLAVQIRRILRAVPSCVRLSARDALILAAGLLGMLFLYSMVLVPENVAYDARWYHLPLAEHYAAAGGVVRSEEGWFLAAYPQLMSYLYTWAFLLPGGKIFDQVGLSAHLEFVVFGATLLSIVPLTRRLLCGRRVPLAWVAVFLFPGIFLYDSGLHVAADRLAGLWGPLIYLALLRAWKALELRWMVVLASCLAGCALTKYSAVTLLVFPVLAIGGRACVLFLQTAHRRDVLRSLGCAVAVGVTLTSIHWLKNWVWYGDPLYPMLHRYLELRPWEPDTLIPFERWFYDPGFRPPRNWAGVGETLRALATFSFVHNDWPDMHGGLPVFGSLFSLTALCLPFVDKRRRIFFLFFATHVALFIWYWLHHFDRYLQILLPWMVAGTVAMMVRIRQLGVASRWSLSLLISAQVIWALDVPFFPGHPMMRSSFPEGLTEHVQAGFAKQLGAAGLLPDKRAERLLPFSPISEIGQNLPPGANVLLHEQHVQLGLGTRRVSDWMGTQGAINYHRLQTPQAISDKLNELQVTHLVSNETKAGGMQSIAADLAFYRFLKVATEKPAVFGKLTLRQLSQKVTVKDVRDDHIAVLGCKPGQPSGIFRFSALARSPYDPAPFDATPLSPLPARGTTSFPESVSFAVSYPGCNLGALGRSFSRLVARPNEQLWIRKTSP